MRDGAFKGLWRMFTERAKAFEGLWKVFEGF